MNRIKIVTDSTADLPRSVVEEYGIEVLPLNVVLGKETYKDGVDINIDKLLKSIEETGNFPSTAQINPAVFKECYSKYINEGYKIISIHLSSKMSGTYQSACIAKDMLETEDIVVLDSLNVTSGLGILAIHAAKLSIAGKNIHEIEEEILEMIPHVKSALAFGSLDNLVKGGRLSKTAGFIGTLLGIKLILTVKDGEMAVMEKVRGNKKVIKKIMNYLEERGIKENTTNVFLNVDNKDILEDLKNKVYDTKENFIDARVGCVVGTHSGADACGIFFVENY